jgi:hypothetical protein
MTANSGFSGKNSMQLGGRSSLKDMSDFMDSMAGRCVVLCCVNASQVVDEALSSLVMAKANASGWV